LGKIYAMLTACQKHTYWFKSVTSETTQNMKLKFWMVLLNV